MQDNKKYCRRLEEKRKNFREGKEEIQGSSRDQTSILIKHRIQLRIEKYCQKRNISLAVLFNMSILENL